MKRCLLLIACLPQLLAFSQQTDKDKAGLKGSVQFVKLFSNEIKSGNTVPQNTTLFLYSDKGQLTGNTIFKGASDAEISSVFYQFKNEQLERKETSGNGIARINDNYQYENGLLVKLEHSAGDKPNTTDIYTYNNKKQLIVLETISQGNVSMGLTQPGQKKYFSYDDAGNITEQKTEGNGGDYTTKNSYSRTNQKIKTEVWSNGKLATIVEYLYDNNNRVIRETRKNSFAKVFSESVYKYDATGHKTESQIKEFNGNKTYISIHNWKYDGDNEIEDAENSEGETTTLTSQYQFDNEGNWISKKTFRNGVLWMDQRREITYR